MLLQWPFAQSAYDKARGTLAVPSWQGSLLRHKQDGSGLEDHRHRLYDPQTGRFTQEDPMGLAGGLNAYGFANGDPVNFSDPFGLCPQGNVKCLLLRSAAVFVAGSVGGTFGAALGAGEGAACGPAVVVCSPALSAAGARAFGGIAALAAGAAVDQLFMSSEATNPDGSAKEPGQQREEIEEAQQGFRKRGQPDRINRIQKSKQRGRQEDLEEAERALNPKPPKRTP